MTRFQEKIGITRKFARLPTPCFSGLRAPRRGGDKASGQPLISSLNLISLGLLIFGLTGCVNSGKNLSPASTSPSGPIDAIHLLNIPVALNMDQAPGPDGFAVKVFATTQTHPKAVAITSGTVEILMFNGRIRDGELKSVKPLRIWSFPAGELRSFAYTGSLGIGYQFALLWGEAKPSGASITVVARYSASGATLYSGPSTIAINAQ